MNVLLINLPLKTTFPAAVYPMGLAYLGAMLERENCEIEVLDIRLHNFTELTVLEYLKANSGRFDLICMSGMVTTYRYAKWLTQHIKIYNKKAIVCIGGSISTVGEMLLSKSELDIVCIGEGEKTIIAIVDAIKSNTSVNNVPNIMYKNGDKIVTTQYASPMDINEIPLPAWHLFNIEKYIHTPYIVPNVKPRINMIIERGCPFKCVFCYRNFGRIIRYRNVDNIVNEINTVVSNFGVKHIDFLDEIFNCNADLVKDLCSKIIQEKINITWRCIGRTDLIDKETLELMFEAGCKWIGYGIESGSQLMLDNMNKKQKIEDIEESIRLSREAGMLVTGTFLLGMPGETYDTIKESCAFFEKNKIYNSPFFPVPYPGTELYDICKKNEMFCDEEKYILSLEGDASELIINLTEINSIELQQIKKDMDKKYGKYFSMIN